MKDWNKKIAIKIANKEGIKKLNHLHCKVISFIRDYYYSFNTLPTYRIIINFLYYKNNNINTEFIYKLFPKGLGQAFKIAGFSNYNKCL